MPYTVVQGNNGNIQVTTMEGGFLAEHNATVPSGVGGVVEAAIIT